MMSKFKSLVRVFFSDKAIETTSQEEEQFLVVSDENEMEVISENLKKASSELERIFYSHSDRRIFKFHHYLEIYDRYFAYLRKKARLPRGDKEATFAPKGVLRILELGVYKGGSLQMWREYFGPEAGIFGIDIDPQCAGFATESAEVRIGDQSDADFLQSVVEEMGGVDIVIDDGSHIASHQLASFRTLFPMLADGGVYICEDLHTSYWDGWEGGFRRPGTFVEVGKSIIDHMHEWYSAVDTELNDMGLKKSVLAIAFYDSIVAIEKGLKTKPYAIHVGQNSINPT